MRELRWISGLPAGKRTALKVVPTEAPKRLDIPHGFSQDPDMYQEQMQRLSQHPGDAWEHTKIDISLHEEAADPYYR